jgi:uncharacterized protein (TIGR03382 family)
VADGTSCANGTVCDGTETCQGGACGPGTNVVCTQPVDGEFLTCQEPVGCARADHAPVITSTAPAGIGVGRTYQYQLTVLGSRALSFSLCGGPSSAAIDAAGLLTWVPLQAETASFCVQVGNSFGSTSQSFQVTAVDLPPDFGDLGLAFTADGGAHFGAALPLAAEVTNHLAISVAPGLVVKMSAQGLALEQAGGPTPTCDNAATASVPALPAQATAEVPVAARVCREPGPDPATLTGHLERADGTRLTADVTLEIPVEQQAVPVGCDCSSAPGVMGAVALLFLVRRRRSRHAGH